MAGDEARRIALAAFGAAIGLGALGLGAITARLVAGARDLVTPPPPARSGRMLAIGDGEVTLSRTAETALPGRYGMWTDDDRGYAKVGEVLREDSGRVTRELIAVEDEPWVPGLVVRMGAAFYRSPEELGVPVEDVEVRTPLGPAPAWLVPAEPGGTADEWAILVHGRDARRWETIRAVPMLREAGLSCLIVSYRNDPGAPASPDGRYHLGEREWYDVEAAIAFAIAHGAKRITLCGWSMGGGIVMQLLRRSPLAAAVTRVLLDSPALDWREVIRLLLERRRIPACLHGIFRGVLTSPRGARLIGLDEPIDLNRLDAVAAADALRVPVLILHSHGDDVVPIGPARDLAAARPDLVELEEFATGAHVRIWNLHRERYEAVIRDWLARTPGSPAQGSTLSAASHLA